MRILVIDDQERNLKFAMELVKYGEVVTIGSIYEAYNLLKEKEFDVVLTDLFMPVGEKGVGDVLVKNRPRVDEEVPAGLIFAIKAANKGARVVICTDSDHHQNYLCSLLDILQDRWDTERKDMVADSQKHIVVVEARYAFVGRTGYSDEGPLVKDWQEVMRRSQLFPELEIPKQPPKK